ncbi:MAG: phenylacetate--CoA ligase family protein [Acidobacteria bacterium]|nr:phenylacetate--CoA ligase family protein [Acidobacteriota bacterium]
MGLYDAIFESIVLPWKDQRHGRPVLPRIPVWTERLSGPRARWQGEQATLLRQMLVHAAETVPFWSERFRDAGFDPRSVASVADLRPLPLLTKDEVRDERVRLLSTAVPESRRVCRTTGGTTSRPLTFYRDDACHADREALAWAFYGWFGRTPAHRHALAWGAVSDFGGAESFRSRVRARYYERCLTLSVATLDDRSMARFIDRFQRFEPLYMHGYAQSIFMLARAFERHQARTPSLRGVSLTAEPIEKDQQAFIEHVFGCPAQNVYGCREFGMMAAQCRERRDLHLNPLSVVVEILDPEGNPAAPGESGEIVVTDLLNRAMPLIRYRLEDYGTLSDVLCPCGLDLPSLDVTAGRVADFLVMPDGRTISALVLIDVVYSPAFELAQLHQPERARVDLLYVPSAAFSESSLQAILARLSEIFGPAVRVAGRAVESIPRSTSGKTRIAVSDVAKDVLLSSQRSRPEASV